MRRRRRGVGGGFWGDGEVLVEKGKRERGGGVIFT
jgi:hypothetical protein